MKNSKIEWTENTWNFLRGCSLKSTGCENCYAMHMSWRFQNNPLTAEQFAGTTRKTKSGTIQWTGKINIDEERLLLPIKSKPGVWFVNSMSDLFHEDVPFDIIRIAWGVMAVCSTSTFQILTKRPERMLEFFKWMHEYDPEPELPLPNVWLGVSTENQKTADERIPLLLQVPAAVRFLSCEPLLSPLDLNNYLYTSMYNKIDWVIVGGESGPAARPMQDDWPLSILYQCNVAKVPFFFKQWGGKNKKITGRVLDGQEWNEMPSKK